MKLIAYISTDIQFTRLQEIDYRRGLVFLQLYDIPYADLSAYAGILITNFVEEAFLLDHKHILEDYLNDGGVIFSQAENFLPWLPGCGNWKRSPISLRDREIRLTEPVHPMFYGIDPYDLNHKKGVRGFFSRGYLEAPEHSEVIVEDQEGKAIIYIDRKTTGGTIVAGAGTDLYRFGIEENSSRVLSTQMLNWIRQEYEANKEEQK
ncbi:UNVERIFIED_ORG: hypothetical protein ABIC97_001025 [Peribacillus simplex]